MNILFIIRASRTVLALSSDKFYKLATIFVASSLLLNIISYPADAREWYVESSAGLTATYDDNIQLTVDDEPVESETEALAREPLRNTSGFIPEFETTIGTASQVTDVSVNLGVDFSRYSENELDSDNGFALFDLTKTTERSNFGLTGGVERNSTLTTEFEESGLLQTNQRREEVSITPSWSRQLNESMTLDIEIDHSDVSFDSDNDEAPFDFEDNSIGAALTRILNERTDVYGTVNLTQFDSPDNNDNKSDDASLSIGVTRQLSEILTGDVSVGSQNSDAEQTIDGERISSSNSGAIYSANLGWNFPLYSISFGVSRSLSSTALGTRSEQTSWDIGFSRELSQSLSVNLTGTFSEDEFFTAEDTTTPNRSYYTIEPGLSWNITSNWELEASYVYRKQEIDDISTSIVIDSVTPIGAGTSATSNAVFSTVRYRWPRQPL